MPTYEYECAHCGHFEIFQKITDKPLETCPKCNKKVRRLISSGAGIIFKGSGKEPTTCPRAKEGCRACPQA